MSEEASMDPASIGIGLQALDFIKNQVVDSGVISAHFSGKGNWLGGSELVKVKVTQIEGHDGVWLYGVEPVDDYTFVHFPLIDSGVVEQLGFEDDNLPNADPGIWRWVPMPSPNTLVGGNYEAPNALAEFIVVGYKHGALIKRFSPHDRKTLVGGLKRVLRWFRVN